jgi:YHS domain-containing protein
VSGCPACESRRAGVSIVEIMPRPAGRLTSVKVRARGEDFRIVRVQGNLFVCAQGCCCGHEEKGRSPVAVEAYEQEWLERGIRSQLHLTFTGCLGPCAVGNNAMLQILGRSIWLKDLNDPALVPHIFDYAQRMLDAGRVLPVPPSLQEHVYERYAPPPGDSYAPLVASSDDSQEGLERLDPVCLMDVDPATARHFVDYQGRRVYFCAPACKKAFVADPATYVAILRGDA